MKSNKYHSDLDYCSISMQVCPICKKEFFKYTVDWAWKTGNLFFCSYSCARKYDARRMKIGNNRGIPVKVDGVSYKTISEASEKTYLGIEVIRDALKRGEIYVKGHSIEPIGTY